MSGWKRHLDGARRWTEPSDGAVARLRSRALDAERGPVRPGVGRWWLAGGTLAAVAAVVAISRPEPTLPTTALAGPSAPIQLTDDVRLTFDGLGSAGGSPDEPRIRWESGDLHVEVRPDRGVALVVETEDARIAVVGTAFDVRRSALGTTVAVDHGRVEVACADGTHRTLGAGEALTCLPTSAAAWTGRARALRAAQRPDAEVLEAVDRGLALCDADGPERGELLVLRLGVLIRAGRNAEAARTADEYLSAGFTAREAEVRAIAEQLRR